MSDRTTFDDIYDSLINGQNKQVVRQIQEMGLHKVPDMLDYFSDELCNQEVAVRAMKIYFAITYNS